MSDQEGDENLDVEERNEGEGEENGDTKGEDETDEKDPDNPLTLEEISKNISRLCKTGDGLSHAYVNLDCKDRSLSDISILAKYIHLQYLNISKNHIRDISAISNLTHLLILRADDNKLTNIQLEELPFLQVASFTNNRIKSTEGLNHPHLEHLNLNYNQIKEIEGLNPAKLSKLHTLELRGNKLKTLKGINMPNIKNLFLAANPLTSIEGLEGVSHLTTLHLRECQVEKLDGFSEDMKNLQYLNLKSNVIQNAKEVKKLQVLPKLRAVVLKFNPMSGEDDYRLEVLIALRRIERLDKDEYADDERQEAEETYEQRRLEELANQEGTQEVISTDNEDD